MAEASPGCKNVAESSNVVPAKTTRSKTAKSRRGCRQCKVRRLKCDETEPACSNCTRRGLQCPGYRRELRWSNKHERYCDAEVSPGVVATPTGAKDATAEAVAYMEHQLAREDLVEPPLDRETLPTEADIELSPDWLEDMPWLQDDWSGALQQSNEAEETSAGPLVTPPIPSSEVARSTPLDFNTPIDVSSTLVDYWFRHVCPMWSAFDSLENFNRRIPSNTWTTSEPVFYTLQAMSAACLADSMPQLNTALPSLIRQASVAIEKKMSTFRNAPNIPAANITLDLVFAVFAMGTSLHWTDNTAHYGDMLLQDAREILGIWAKNLTAVDAVVHAYFHQALTYWEMLLAVSDDHAGHERLDCKRLDYQVRLRQALCFDGSDASINQSPPRDETTQALVSSSPVSWCGVSSDVIDLFGQVLTLCRGSRNRHRKHPGPTIAESSNALSDIGVAHDLQRDLLTLDFSRVTTDDALGGITLQTGDEKTPITHLVYVAEAYRQASLIQLYLTFEDLDVKRSTKELTSIGVALAQLSFTPDLPREQKLVVMSLQLVAILEQIPADSGSRCIQPVLLILAAAGLKFDKSPLHQQGATSSCSLGWAATESADGASESSTGKSKARSPPHDGNITPNLDMAFLPGFDNKSLAPNLPITGPIITQLTFQVSNARRLVKSRLRNLQDILPARPLRIADDLVNAIWSEYDGPDCAHWLDIMSDTGLKTMFC